jgi:hemerythrin
MDRDKPICYSCVHDEEGQGILVAALINFMCTQHNDFVRLIDETMLKNNRHEHRDAVSQSVVPLAEVLPAHMLVYDFQGSFMPLIEKQCVSFTPQGAVEYDFETAQQYLLNKWLCKPEIEAVIGNFLFLEEQEAKNALKQLGKIVKQKPLPKQVEKGIRQEITNPIQAQACLDALSTCVSFLKGAVLESGDAMVEDDDLAKMGIGKYAADTLKMEGSAFGSKTVSGQVELCHLSNLWELLLEIVDPDPTAEVHEVYKAPLTAEQEKQISAAAATFDDGFAETMSEFMQQYLKEHNMKKDDPLKSTLGYCEMGDEYLFQLQWFSNTFDDSFKLEQIVAIFKLITSS